MTYLSALLEKHPYISGPQPQSHKVTVIKAFLDKVVNVVPLESVGYAMAHGNDHVAQHCVNVVDALFDDLPSSCLMNDGFEKAVRRVDSGMPVEIANELVAPLTDGHSFKLTSRPYQYRYSYNKEDETLKIIVAFCDEKGILTHTYSFDELKKKHGVAPNVDLSEQFLLTNIRLLQEKIFNKFRRSGVVSSVICGLSISSLYGVSNEQLKSPIETLQLGKEKLASTSDKFECLN